MLGQSAHRPCLTASSSRPNRRIFILSEIWSAVWCCNFPRLSDPFNYRSRSNASAVIAVSLLAITTSTTLRSIHLQTTAFSTTRITLFVVTEILEKVLKQFQIIFYDYKRIWEYSKGNLNHIPKSKRFQVFFIVVIDNRLAFKMTNQFITIIHESLRVALFYAAIWVLSKDLSKINSIWWIICLPNSIWNVLKSLLRLRIYAALFSLIALSTLLTLN